MSSCFAGYVQQHRLHPGPADHSFGFGCEEIFLNTNDRRIIPNRIESPGSGRQRTVKSPDIMMMVPGGRIISTCLGKARPAAFFRL